MKVQVKKWGNSASVRIPSAIMAAASLHIDQHVNVREEGGRVVIEPIAAPAFDLDTLLDQVTSENLHDPVDFGAPMGNELW
ncbi:AbrB/MazE/SpoVT family DNA-binding domain-containing protein [Sphingomonas sp. AR_OL41]|uniref:AbrB/MazE/SpoVT family DNA-binding domain-containing protein n=1 Tax=Sphingomonas sp. AR_OL41 TaxID=3042729 RepID=UPI0024801422|nr:AbrB/MazE/SpoVT family DNA-binding domain-containing protein [Sphingomonas sp. AR_OL41]MDH7974159.1 AbrB/MazE/SpoVT family DNA-binding domain-containing protein [Sphingomonas sp. AR_OL41]